MGDLQAWAEAHAPGPAEKVPYDLASRSDNWLDDTMSAQDISHPGSRYLADGSVSISPMTVPSVSAQYAI